MMKKAQDGRTKLGLKKEEEEAKVLGGGALLRSMLGVMSSKEFAGKELIEYGIRGDIAGSVRIGEYLCGGRLPRGLERQVRYYLVER